MGVLVFGVGPRLCNQIFEFRFNSDLGLFDIFAFWYSAALNPNGKTLLAQRRAILVKVFIQLRVFKGDPLLERSKNYLN